MKEKIVVTGYGIVSNLGVGVEKNRAVLQNGSRNDRRDDEYIREVRYLTTCHKDIPCGEVKESDEELARLAGVYSPENTKVFENVTLTRNPLMAMVALKEAMATSMLTDETATAFINGTTVGGMEKSEEYYRDFFKNRHTEYIRAHDCGYGTEVVGRLFGRFDYMTTISTACSSGANSIVLGANLIKSGRVDAAIVGGSESLSKFHLNGFNSLKILENRPCRPFDEENKGLNLGEGAAYIVIERESVALKRHARIKCELSGYANCCDAYHQTTTSPESEGEFLAMMKAIKSSSLQPSDIDYVNVHGTGTRDNDLHESIALKRVFGQSIPPFSSTKEYTGHTTSAAGALEAVFSVMAIEYGFIPGNGKFNRPIEETGLKPISESIQKELRHVMSNSFGFGGNDTAIVFSKY